jgi:hypothetical protein
MTARLQKPSSKEQYLTKKYKRVHRSLGNQCQIKRNIKVSYRRPYLLRLKMISWASKVSLTLHDCHAMPRTVMIVFLIIMIRRPWSPKNMMTLMIISIVPNNLPLRSNQGTPLAVLTVQIVRAMRTARIINSSTRSTFGTKSTTPISSQYSKLATF